MPESAELKALQTHLDKTTGAVKAALHRFVCEIEMAVKVLDLHPEKAEEWNALMAKAMLRVKSAVDEGMLDILPQTVADAEAVLAPIGEVLKTYTVYNVGHGHIDMNWMWSWPETVAVTNDTFSTVDRLMDEYSDFCYSQSQTSVYEITRKHFPELFERIKARVKEGRWEITASQWVECDKNISGGETLFRHLLYTREFMKEHFGMEPEDIPIDWEPDTFGHANTIPTILSKGRVKRYYSCRQGIERPPAFWWEGPDGGRVLVFKEMSGSWYNGEIDHPTLVKNLTRFCKATGLRAWMNVYGVGDHGGGPTRQHIERAHEMDAWPVYPNVKLSTSKPIYELLESVGETLPVLAHELNYEFTGCYTSQSSIKQGNRHCEELLIQAEAASALAWAVGLNDYARENLREGWVNLLFNQFHDILPGSGVRDTVEYARGLYQEAEARAGAALTRGLRSMAGAMNTKALVEGEITPGPGIGAGAGFGAGQGALSALDDGASSVRPFVVFNTNGWERTGVVEAKLWDTGWDKNTIVVSDVDGNEIAAQVTGDGHYWGHRYINASFPVKDVPALGGQTYLISEGTAPVDADVLAYERNAAGDLTVENEYLSVQIDNRTGGISKLVDKESGRDFVKPGEVIGVLELATERHHGMSAWVIGDIMKSRMLTELVSLHHSGGPYVSRHTGVMNVNDTKITVSTVVRVGSPVVEIVLDVDWVERGNAERGVPMLRANFPLALGEKTSAFETPYGSVERDLFEGQEVPAMRWADVSDGEGGVTLINDCKHGHSIDGDNLRLTLIRGTYDPDPLPEQGHHTIRMALMPHAGALDTSAAVRAGREFGQPLHVVGTTLHEGCLPPAGSCMSVEEDNVVLAVMKKAESADAVVIRLLETTGEDTEAHVFVHNAMCLKSAAVVDALEMPAEGGEARLDGETLTVSVPANSIVSVMLSK